MGMSGEGLRGEGVRFGGGVKNMPGTLAESIALKGWDVRELVAFSGTSAA